MLLSLPVFQIGAIIFVAASFILFLVLLFLIIGICLTAGAQSSWNSFVDRSFEIAEILILTIGIMLPYALFLIFVKPSRQLLLGIQQVSTSQAFFTKSLKTTDQNLTHIFPHSYLPSSSCPGY